MVSKQNKATKIPEVTYSFKELFDRSDKKFYWLLGSLFVIFLGIVGLILGIVGLIQEVRSDLSSKIDNSSATLSAKIDKVSDKIDKVIDKVHSNDKRINVIEKVKFKGK